MMAQHEGEGAVSIWTHRLVFCRHCKYEYEQVKDEDYSCPACGYEENYYVLEEYYD